MFSLEQASSSLWLPRYSHRSTVMQCRIKDIMSTLLPLLPTKYATTVTSGLFVLNECSHLATRVDFPLPRSPCSKKMDFNSSTDFDL
ncbi:hypothetical protein FKM82_012464 [Ascaphus truei]